MRSLPSISSTFAHRVCSKTAATLIELLRQTLGRPEARAGDRDAETAAARTEVRRRRERVLRHDAYVGELGPEVVGEHLRATVYCPCPSSAKPTRTLILPKMSRLTVAPSGTPVPGWPTIEYAFQSNTPGSIVFTSPMPR
jgi:hypothetical protein